ncbi:MAG: thiamine-binding protein [Sphingobacteriia bacterium]|nr:thiamine-binding protein [Sphingobacteriia bacterium]
MHSYIINASIQIVPVVLDKHPYEWVDEAIAIIQKSGIKYEVGAFSTVLEGTYEEVMGVIHQVNEYLYNRNCAEWISNLQIQIRSQGAVTGEEKTGKFKHS